MRTAPIDEVQVIDGASTFSFLADSIHRVTNQTIRRDFNENEAIAMGTTIAALGEEDVFPYIRIYFRALPSVTLNMTSGDPSPSYSTKAGQSVSKVSFEDRREMCPEITVVADPARIPANANLVFGRYRPKEVPDIGEAGPLTVVVHMWSVDGAIGLVDFYQGVFCQNVELEELHDNDNGLDSAVWFM
jgi:hypothetical protein